MSVNFTVISADGLAMFCPRLAEMIVRSPVNLTANQGPTNTGGIACVLKADHGQDTVTSSTLTGKPWPHGQGTTDRHLRRCRPEYGKREQYQRFNLLEPGIVSRLIIGKITQLVKEEVISLVCFHAVSVRVQPLVDLAWAPNCCSKQICDIELVV